MQLKKNKQTNMFLNILVSTNVLLMTKSGNCALGLQLRDCFYISSAHF